MQQEINLYKLLPQVEKKPLSLETILILFGLFLLLLLFNYIHSLTQKNALLDELQQLNLQLITEKKNLSDVLEKYPLINPDDLEGSLIKLKANLASKSKLVEAFANPVKFSDYLSALSNTDITGAWLMGFSILKNGLQIELYGQASKHENVENYYEKLKVQPFFSTMKFEITDIMHPKTEDVQIAAVSFTITGKANNLYEE